MSLLLALAGTSLVAKAEGNEFSTNKQAVVEISGFGFLENRDLVRLLRNFQPDGKLPSYLDRFFVEDASLVLFARAWDEGYLHSTLSAEFETRDGWLRQFVWTNALEVVLPADFEATSARFRLNSGVRFHYRTLQFEGLETISERKAKGYFVSTEMLLKLPRYRIFTPDKLQGSLAALREAYARAGYQQAEVTTNKLTINEASGAVDVTVAVHEGLPTIVRSVDVTISGEAKDLPVQNRTMTPNAPYSQFWQQRLAQSLRTEQFHKGFPDATVTFSVKARETNDTSIQIDLSADIMTGPLVRVGKVLLQGYQRTQPSVLESRVELHPDDLLDRVKAEESRQKLARLGAFDWVGLSYDEVDDSTRDVIYDFQEGRAISISLLAGYGSYELLRGGVDFEHRNVFGLGQSVRIRAVQSFKSSQGDLLYTVPDVFGKNLNLFLQGDGLRREEVSFTREDYGGSIGIQKRLVPIQTDFSLRYDYEFLNALDFASSSTNLPGVTEARSAAFALEMNCDRRDHPLLPEKGSRLYGRVEIASEALGGNVDYQRLILGASYHFDLHGGRLLHLGVRHGMTFTLGGISQDLPFSKRYFPGGANSVRGYQEGEACPVDANGNQLGAETYTEGTIELEQLLTKSWSVVAFFDAVGFAESRDDYPWDEGLYSVGGGIRWRSLIGPVRLEYGYNLHRRTHDPVGTLHFSVGYPF